MTDIAATLQVRDAILAWLSADVPTITWFADRSDQEPYQDSDFPVGNIRLLNFSIAPFEDMSMARWTGLLQFDFISGGTASLTIDDVNQHSIALTIRSLHTSDYLGGMLDLLEPDGADASEQSAPDAGWAVLQYQIAFFTPRADPFTISGLA